MEYFEIFGIIVYEKRVARKMSRKDLAVATGYSETQIGRLERGKIKNPAYKMIAEIEDMFQCQSVASDLKLIEGPGKAGILVLNSNITKCKNVCVINQSPTGIYEKVIDLQKL